MAIFHLSVKTISRSAGRSATAAAAYRGGVKIADERTGEIHDYRRRTGVESAVLLLPANAPDWATNRAALWNAAEYAETRKNSTVAREFEIALPAELSADERKQLVHAFARQIVEHHGCAVDVAIHTPSKKGDNRNHHAHLLLTTRRLTATGFTEKTRELDDLKTGEIGRWRERFADMQNLHLLHHDHSAQVDHRSLEAQAIDQEPTRHLGPAATGYERRTGQPSRKRQDYEAEAAERRQARAREAGELERQRLDTERSILGLSGELDAAKRERWQQEEDEIERAWQAEAERQRLIAEARAQIERQRQEAERQRQEAAEAERQRLAAQARAQAERQRQEAAEAERQRLDEQRALLQVNIPGLERELAEWIQQRQGLVLRELPPAAWLADKWGELKRAKQAEATARQALDALEAAYADWCKTHRLGLMLSPYIPGSKRREKDTLEQRLTEARTILKQAESALAVAQKAYEARLPAAECEAQQLAEERQQQLAIRQKWITQAHTLLQQARTAQNADQERREAEIRAQMEAERRQWEAEQRKTQEPECPLAEPTAPKQESPKSAIPALQPKPRYPAPGG